MITSDQFFDGYLYRLAVGLSQLDLFSRGKFELALNLEFACGVRPGSSLSERRELPSRLASQYVAVQELDAQKTGITRQDNKRPERVCAMHGYLSGNRLQIIRENTTSQLPSQAFCSRGIFSLAFCIIVVILDCLFGCRSFDRKPAR